jgi:hypothetical protein
MIRVELGEMVTFPNRHTKWRWRVENGALSGFSPWPLLDACRAIQRMGGHLAVREIGLYRPGKDLPDLVTTVGYGATRMVDERGTPRFTKWNSNPLWNITKDKP